MVGVSWQLLGLWPLALGFLHTYIVIHGRRAQIDDISFVVDTGRVKETRYDPSTHMSSLVAVYTSKAAASQRAGRAGRVRAGDCFRLYSQEFFETQMPEYTLPEMLRTPLVRRAWKERKGDGRCALCFVCVSYHLALHFPNLTCRRSSP